MSYISSQRGKHSSTSNSIQPVKKNSIHTQNHGISRKLPFWRHKVRKQSPHCKEQKTNFTSRPWDTSLWTASDDRVRGGSSISHLTVSSPTQAVYHGHLDTKTLGGAGFASQRTIGDLALDLSHTTGLQLVLGAGSSEQKFTLNVKDTIPGKRTDGRDEAGISWEVDFEAPREGGVLVKKWDEFKATYRGREVKDPEPLKVDNIKRMSLMTRR